MPALIGLLLIVLVITWPHKYTGTVNGIGPYYGEWVKITFSDATTVTKISLESLTTGDNCPKDFVILGSSDNSNWNLLKQYEGLSLANYFDVDTDGNISNRHPFFAILNQPETYKYFAIVIQAIDNNNGTGSTTTGFVAISEIDLLGPSSANFPITYPVEQRTITIPIEGSTVLETQERLLTSYANHTITASSSKNNTTLPNYVFDNKILTSVSYGLYDFTEHTFTNAGSTGQNGPTISQMRSAYSGVSWAQNDAYFTGGIFPSGLSRMGSSKNGHL